MLQQEVRRLPPASVMHLREGTDHFSNKTKLRQQFRETPHTSTAEEKLRPLA